MSQNAPSKTGRWIAFIVTLSAIGVIFMMLAKNLRPEKEATPVTDYTPWTEVVVETAAEIPVQDGGRVKPLETFASFTMLKLHGDRKISVIGTGGQEFAIGPMEWLLDVLFRPQDAIKMPSFRVDNSEVLELVGLPGKEKRDRYSYLEIADARETLMSLRDSYLSIQQGRGKLEPSQSQTLDLANNVLTYEVLLGYFTFARQGVELQGAAADGSSQFQRVSSVMATADVVQAVIDQVEAEGSPLPEKLRSLLEQVTTMSNFARGGLLLFPPDNLDENDPWKPAGAKIFGVMTGEIAEAEPAIRDIVALENLYATSGRETDEFVEALTDFRINIEGRAEKRGEQASLKWEHIFNKGQWFFRAMGYCFVPGILFLLLSWLKPDGRWGAVMVRLVWITCIAGLVLVITGTTLRSIVMQRPPVGNLYDTMPFITIGCVLLCLITEALTRRRMALGMAPIIGFIGLAMAQMYEFGEGRDPMDPLVAVLRSNYWLTIHVLTITLGYSAGLAAAGFGMTFLFRKVFGLFGENESKERRALTRMTFGTICFTLLLSLVGTVLGGVWANYSWGRFWGWDPKENGALLLVLWSLFILHGRVGGYLRDWGINLCAIFTAAIVTFSWWHVNLLGVGLHSYGFSDSKKNAVMGVYGLIGLVLLLGIGYAIAEKEKKRRKKSDRGAMPSALPEEG